MSLLYLSSYPSLLESSFLRSDGLDPLHQILHLFREWWRWIHVMQISNLRSAANKPGPEGTSCGGVCACLCVTCSETPSVCIYLQWNYSSSGVCTCVFVPTKPGCCLFIPVTSPPCTVPLPAVDSPLFMPAASHCLCTGCYVRHHH